MIRGAGTFQQASLAAQVLPAPPSHQRYAEGNPVHREAVQLPELHEVDVGAAVIHQGDPL